MTWIRNRLPMAIPPVQVPLPLGFWTEPQKETAASRRRSRTPAGSESREAHPPMTPRDAATGLDAPEVIEVRIDGMRLVNPLNGSQGTTRGAMFAASKRRKDERERVQLEMARANIPAWSAFRLTFIRIATGKFDDDNYRASCKSIRDEAAKALGFRNDSTRLLAFEYEQQLSPRSKPVFAVIIRIEPLPASAAPVSARPRPRARKQAKRLGQPDDDR